ncbi:MAG: sigma factor [Myxococcales bacterium]|nr:sigma factor [Myxococcales bacterium]
MSDALHEALRRLRNREGLPSDPAWRIVRNATFELARRHARSRADAEDAAQAAAIRVLRSVHHARLESPAAARAWLRRIVVRIVIDQSRERKARLVAPERLAALVEAPPTAQPPAPDEILEHVMRRLDAHLTEAETRPSKRLADRRRAELALRRNLLGQDLDVLARDAADLSRDALSKWIERGRERILVPMLEASLRERAIPLEERTVLETALHALRRARRADSGRPRPDRRKPRQPATDPTPHAPNGQSDPEAAVHHAESNHAGPAPAHRRSKP